MHFPTSFPLSPVIHGGFPSSSHHSPWNTGDCTGNEAELKTACQKLIDSPAGGHPNEPGPVMRVAKKRIASQE